MLLTQLIPTIDKSRSDHAVACTNKELSRFKRSNVGITRSVLAKLRTNVLEPVPHISMSESEETKPVHVRPKAKTVLSMWREFWGNISKSGSSNLQAESDKPERAKLWASAEDPVSITSKGNAVDAILEMCKAKSGELNHARLFKNAQKPNLLKSMVETNKSRQARLWGSNGSSACEPSVRNRANTKPTLQRPKQLAALPARAKSCSGRRKSVFTKSSIKRKLPRQARLLSDTIGSKCAASISERAKTLPNLLSPRVGI